MTLLSQSCDNVVTVLGQCCDIVVAVLKKCYDTPLQNCDTFLNPRNTAASPLLHCLVVLGHCCYIPMTELYIPLLWHLCNSSVTLLWLLCDTIFTPMTPVTELRHGCYTPVTHIMPLRQCYSTVVTSMWQCCDILVTPLQCTRSVPCECPIRLIRVSRVSHASSRSVQSVPCECLKYTTMFLVSSRPYINSKCKLKKVRTLARCSSQSCRVTVNTWGPDFPKTTFPFNSNYEYGITWPQHQSPSFNPPVTTPSSISQPLVLSP